MNENANNPEKIEYDEKAPMPRETLLAHLNAGRIANLDAIRNFDTGMLEALPDPVPMTDTHKPTRHDVFIKKAVEVFGNNGLEATSTRTTLSGDGKDMISVVDFAPHPEFAHLTEDGRGLMAAFRNSHKMRFSHLLLAGIRAWICWNGQFSADTVLMRKRHTKGFDLAGSLADTVPSYLSTVRNFDMQVERFRSIDLQNVDAAKAVLADAFLLRDTPVLPVTKARTVSNLFFNAPNLAGTDDAMPDCEPRTLDGLLNAFTRETQNCRTLNSRTMAEQAVTAFGLEVAKERFGRDIRNETGT